MISVNVLFFLNCLNKVKYHERKSRKAEKTVKVICLMRSNNPHTARNLMPVLVSFIRERVKCRYCWYFNKVPVYFWFKFQTKEGVGYSSWMYGNESRHDHLYQRQWKKLNCLNVYMYTMLVIVSCGKWSMKHHKSLHCGNFLINSCKEECVFCLLSK